MDQGLQAKKECQLPILLWREARSHPITSLRTTNRLVNWTFNITANGLEDLETQLPELIALLVSAGGWIMGSAISNEGAVRVRFEFERRASMEIYTALIEAALELSAASHMQLAQLCHCSKGGQYRLPGSGLGRSEQVAGNPGTALVDLHILSSQVDNFDQLPESTPGQDAPTRTSSA
jgi:hypothetical protein